MTNPAAWNALLKGDLDNYRVASTPGGILAQEKAGQAQLVASTDMPKDLMPDRASFERLGFEFGEDIDSIFMKAKLPLGWTRVATEHSMHSEILDARGRKRVSVFYKAAFYDRRADARLIPRFKVEDLYPEHDGPIRENDVVHTIVTDTGKEIYRVGSSRRVGDWKNHDVLHEEAKAWLDANRPGWSDIVESWGMK